MDYDIPDSRHEEYTDKHWTGNISPITGIFKSFCTRRGGSKGTAPEDNVGFAANTATTSSSSYARATTIRNAMSRQYSLLGAGFSLNVVRLMPRIGLL